MFLFIIILSYLIAYLFISDNKASTETADRPIVGSAGAEPSSRWMIDTNLCSMPHPPASSVGTLFNPFKPAEFSVKITANRRRWIHVFPTGKIFSFFGIRPNICYIPNCCISFVINVWLNTGLFCVVDDNAEAGIESRN